MLLEDPLVREAGQYGEVFTRRWVVEFILDLVGYVAEEEDLGQKVIVEPSCGTGAFLIPAVERLIDSARIHGRDLSSLRSAIRAFDLLDANASIARKAAATCLVDAGVVPEEADEIAGTWVLTGDFLLYDHLENSADFVVGNPPYIRLEDVPSDLTTEYRRRCPTMKGRADIYVGFIERALDLLKPAGRLGFICADRWMHNQYGSALRRLVAERFAVDTVVAMHEVDAFEDEVSAYPAVIVLRNGKQESVRAVETSQRFGPLSAKTLSRWAREPLPAPLTDTGFKAAHLEGWFGSADLWPTGSPAQLELLRHLETHFGPLEDPATGTRVGIGVASGCDEVFITNDAGVVEAERLLPLLRAEDITTGRVSWSGGYLVNPWDQQGLVSLEAFPLLKSYLLHHEQTLRERHVAKRRPAQWFRTIDRVNLGLLDGPRLLLPDMKAAAHPVLDDDRRYPHHNLYHVTSGTWDLEVLGGLLLSEIANLFVGAYCVKMRGGCYRFQAQYLRRIRLPRPDAVSKAEACALASAFQERDVERATGVARRLYGLDQWPTNG